MNIRHRFPGTKYGPITKDHDLTKETCSKCNNPFEVGEYTTMVHGPQTEITHGLSVCSPIVVHYECSASPSDLLVSSVAIDEGPAHDHVCVWNRGCLSGVLMVEKGDGDRIADRLLSDAPKLETDPKAAPLPDGSWKEHVLASFAYVADPDREPVPLEKMAKLRAELDTISLDEAFVGVTRRVAGWAGAIHSTESTIAAVASAGVRPADLAQSRALRQRGREALRKSMVAALSILDAIAAERS